MDLISIPPAGPNPNHKRARVSWQKSDHQCLDFIIYLQSRLLASAREK